MVARTMPLPGRTDQSRHVTNLLILLFDTPALLASLPTSQLEPQPPRSDTPSRPPSCHASSTPTSHHCSQLLDPAPTSRLEPSRPVPIPTSQVPSCRLNSDYSLLLGSVLIPPDVPPHLSSLHPRRVISCLLLPSHSAPTRPPGSRPLSSSRLRLLMPAHRLPAPTCQPRSSHPSTTRRTGPRHTPGASSVSEAGLVWLVGWRWQGSLLGGSLSP